MGTFLCLLHTTLLARLPEAGLASPPCHFPDSQGLTLQWGYQMPASGHVGAPCSTQAPTLQHPPPPPSAQLFLETYSMPGRCQSWGRGPSVDPGDPGLGSPPSSLGSALGVH